MNRVWTGIQNDTGTILGGFLSEGYT